MTVGERDARRRSLVAARRSGRSAGFSRLPRPFSGLLIRRSRGRRVGLSRDGVGRERSCTQVGARDTCARCSASGFDSGNGKAQHVRAPVMMGGGPDPVPRVGAAVPVPERCPAGLSPRPRFALESRRRAKRRSGHRAACGCRAALRVQACGRSRAGLRGVAHQRTHHLRIEAGVIYGRFDLNIDARMALA